MRKAPEVPSRGGEAQRQEAGSSSSGGFPQGNCIITKFNIYPKEGHDFQTFPLSLLYMKVTQKNLPSLIHFPNASNSQRWNRQKPENRNTTWITHGSVSSPTISATTAASLGVLAASWIRSKQGETQSSHPDMSCDHPKQQLKCST